MTSVDDILASDAKTVTLWLDRYFDKLIAADDIDTAPHLIKAMRYAVLNGGKRLRANLVFSSYRFACSDQTPVMFCDIAGIAAAVEMIHAYSLVHDDLPAMDDADMRRGVLSCHKAFDEATAILVGDALQTEAFTILSQADLMQHPQRQLRLVHLLACASGHFGMAGGQMLDMQAIQSDYLDGKQIQKLQQMKTGALITHSAMMGAWAGGGNDTMLQDIHHYASRLGFAFQIIDDLLDYEAEASQLGKPVGRDADLGKASFVTYLGRTEAKSKATTLIAEACRVLEHYGEASAELIALAEFTLHRQQ